MEPIAVNRIIVDKALFSEAHAAIFSKKRQKMLLLKPKNLLILIVAYLISIALLKKNNSNLKTNIIELAKPLLAISRFTIEY